MSDEELLNKGGDEHDIASFAEQNGARSDWYDAEADTNQASEDGLRELAERYAKDFGIRYDKIRINQKGSITYRQSGDNSGGWQESGSSVNLPMWAITRHYQLIRTEKQKLLAEVRERVVGEDTTYEGHTMNWAIEHHNHLRAEQRENLTKLEAGL